MKTQHATLQQTAGCGWYRRRPEGQRRLLLPESPLCLGQPLTWRVFKNLQGINLKCRTKWVSRESHTVDFFCSALVNMARKQISRGYEVWKAATVHSILANRGYNATAFYFFKQRDFCCCSHWPTTNEKQSTVGGNKLIVTPSLPYIREWSCRFAVKISIRTLRITKKYSKASIWTMSRLIAHRWWACEESRTN